MRITKRSRGDQRRLARSIAKESDAMQRDRLQSVSFALQGRETLEIAGTVGRSRAFVQRWAFAYRNGGISSGVVEGFNGKAKLATRKAYGFRTPQGIEMALFHVLGRLPEPECTDRFC